VRSPGREDDDVHPLARRPDLDRELRLAIPGLELVLAHQRLLKVLTDVLLGGVANLPTGEEVRDPTLGHRAGRD